MFDGLTEALVEDYKSTNDYEGFIKECYRVLSMDIDIEQETFAATPVPQLVDLFQEKVFAQYNYKTDQINKLLLPGFKSTKENYGDRYSRISVPYTDGSPKPLNISADLQKGIDTEGQSIMKDIEKTVTLALIDDNWKEHLRSMDELKDSVQSASFEQKDPLVIYKMEAYNLFEQFIYKVNLDVVSYLMNGKLVFRGQPENLQEAKEQKTDLSKARTNKTEQAMKAAAASANRPQKVETVKREQPKVGRNAPCPCGSGKKYKQCHGK